MGQLTLSQPVGIQGSAMSKLVTKGNMPCLSYTYSGCFFGRVTNEVSIYLAKLILLSQENTTQVRNTRSILLKIGLCSFQTQPPVVYDKCWKVSDNLRMKKKYLDEVLSFVAAQSVHRFLILNGTDATKLEPKIIRFHKLRSTYGHFRDP